MCGIAGWLSFSSPASECERESLGEKMIACIKHRGPDSHGVWVDPRVDLCLSHSRLSILDLTEAGHQPITSPCGQFVLVFNGEIYNHKELRGELLLYNSSLSFRGHSDTEVLLLAIVSWGLEDTLKKLNGMFVFAVWDKQAKSLSIARDRFGEKPLYYGWQGDSFIFASELSPLKIHPEWRGLLDREAVLLLCRHQCIPAPFSVFRDIKKLKTGHFLVLRQGVADELESYWSIDDVVKNREENLFIGSREEATDELEKLLVTAVDLRTEADVPIGAFLSGGIDSSLITSIMARSLGSKVKTYSIGFNEKGFNEARYAKEIASHLDTDHHELYVSPSDSLSVVPDLPSLYDEPFADVSQIPVVLLARFARSDVTVALTGDGGDEVFGGYHRHIKGEKLWKGVDRIPSSVRSAVAKGIHLVPSNYWDAAARPFNQLLPDSLNSRTFGGWLYKTSDLFNSRSPSELYQNLVSVNEPLIGLVKGLNGTPLFLWGGEWGDSLPSITERMMWSDSKGYLVDDVLTKVDRATMAVGLEARVPFLDHRLVQFAWTLPVSYKVSNNVGKTILRDVLSRYVPRELYERPKQGFSVPIDDWLRKDLRPWAEELLATGRLEEEGVFDAVLVRHFWNTHLDGKRNNERVLWPILMFQAWLSKNPDVNLVE